MTSSSIPAADFATDNPDNGPLHHLDVILDKTQFGYKPLTGITFSVIGAGPAGLLFAKSAAEQGADVTVFEKAGDPRTQHSGYINRSFNITITNVGRHVLADAESWENGIWLKGRALHNFQGTDTVHYASYGPDRISNLISIPRTALRKNMVDSALQAGATIRFRSKVTRINSNDGTVYFADNSGDENQLRSDLIVICDGLHSIGNAILEELNDKTFIKPETRSYVTALVHADKHPRLSLQHIHFWHEPDGDAYTVGIPNGDGSIALLLSSKFRGFKHDEYPFSTKLQSQVLLKKDFPHLFDVVGDQLVEQLPSRTRGYFKYKAVPTYLVGQRAVLVGDAGCAVPPWAGFGANSAMYGAASLVYQIAANNADLDRALTIYQAQQLSLSRKIMEYVNDHGEFLNGPVGKNPSGRPDTALGDLIKEARQESMEQIPVQFDDTILSNVTSIAATDTPL